MISKRYIIKLREFSIVDFIKDGIKGLVLKAKDFVLGLFDIDFRAVLGKFVDIGKSIGRECYLKPNFSLNPPTF